MMDVVQRGTEGAPIVALWLVDARPGSAAGEAMAASLRAVLPGIWILTNHERALVAPLVHELRALAPGAGPLIVGGWSAGCQTVRALVRNHADTIDGAIVLDGTSGSCPLDEAMHVAPWRELAGAARRREKLFVATCTQQSYTEKLPPGQRFAWTRHVLEAALGQQLQPGAEVHEGALHVYSVASREVDASAHIEQVRTWLPRLLRMHVAPWLGGGSDRSEEADTEPHPAGTAEPSRASWAPSDQPAGPATVAPWLDPALPRGARAALWSLAELAAGVREDPPGSNTGPRIREYLEPCERAGRRLGLTTAAWCAAGACAADRAVALPGEQPRHGYRASGIELQDDMRAAGRWVPAASLRSGAEQVRVGDLVVLRRGGADWMTHTCRVLDVGEGGAYRTIGGNEADGWRVTERRVNDVEPARPGQRLTPFSLLGVGRIDDAPAADSDDELLRGLVARALDELSRLVVG